MTAPAGIGELNERSLHRALKARYATAGSRVEERIDGFVADIVGEDGIIEIHTGNFWPLKRKLPKLLRRHAVTLVHPIAADRYLLRIPNVEDAPTTRRKSPKHGSVFGIFGVLTSIATLLEHPRMSLHVAMTVEDAVQVWDPRARRRRGGWTTVDRQLVEVVETHRIDAMRDLFAFVDDRLGEEFTTQDLATAMGTPRRLGQQAAFCFREAGVCDVVGKQGNALVYGRSEAA